MNIDFTNSLESFNLISIKYLNFFNYLNSENLLKMGSVYIFGPIFKITPLQEILQNPVFLRKIVLIFSCDFTWLNQVWQRKVCELSIELTKFFTKETFHRKRSNINPKKINILGTSKWWSLNYLEKRSGEVRLKNWLIGTLFTFKRCSFEAKIWIN